MSNRVQAIRGQLEFYSPMFQKILLFRQAPSPSLSDDVVARAAVGGGGNEAVVEDRTAVPHQVDVMAKSDSRNSAGHNARKFVLRSPAGAPRGAMQKQAALSVEETDAAASAMDEAAADPPAGLTWAPFSLPPAARFPPTAVPPPRTAMKEAARHGRPPEQAECRGGPMRLPNLVRPPRMYDRAAASQPLLARPWIGWRCRSDRTVTPGRKARRLVAPRLHRDAQRTPYFLNQAVICFQPSSAASLR